MKKEFPFPKGFLWGTATASQQVEGQNTNNNWHTWENTPGKIIDGSKADLASDWRGGRWKEDFQRAQDTGQNSHRFSLEWSRIQPSPKEWDEKELGFYVELCQDLISRGMTPFITLHHFSNPIWLEEMGGWLNPEAIDHFTRFAAKVVEALKDYTNLWCTINEPNVYATQAFLFGEFPPGHYSLMDTLKVMEHLALAHGAAYKTIHKIQPEARVGMAVQVRGFEPARKYNPIDRLLAYVIHRSFNEFHIEAAHSGQLNLIFSRKFYPELENTQDWIGLQYYTTDQVKLSLAKADEMFLDMHFKEDANLSPTGFIALEPEKFYELIKWANRYNKPMIITENGVEDPDGAFRPKYLVSHIYQVWKAINEGMRIKGYYHWSLVDNWEWERGWTQRFGLWGLNVETQERIKRPSVDIYEQICKSNKISEKQVLEFASEWYEEVQAK